MGSNNTISGEWLGVIQAAPPTADGTPQTLVTLGPLVFGLELFGIGLFLLQLPLTYAVAARPPTATGRAGKATGERTTFASQSEGLSGITVSEDGNVIFASDRNGIYEISAVD